MYDVPISIPYGDHSLTVVVPEKNLLGTILPQQEVFEPRDEAEIICSALEHPTGAPRLREMAQPGNHVCIVTSDMTRPCPSARLLPYVLDELAAAGVPDEEIFVVLGLGLHRKMSADEIEAVVGPQVLQRVRVLNHDIEDVVRLGVTSRGTPVEFYRAVVEADLRVCLGNLEFHWFAGYSGGAKAVLPGVASRACILANHGLMVQPGGGAGRIETNALRLDIEEGAAMLGVDFILNVVMDGEHNLLEAVAGEVTAAHRQGCRAIAERGMVALERPADIVIAGAGGFPKDINMVQAHKGMENASHFGRDGGALILAAECREGWGHAVFESWMKAAASPQDILNRIQQQFEFGGHKAAGIANIERRMSVYLVSALPDETVRQMFMTPAVSVQAALDDALRRLGPDSSVLALPQAGSVIAHIPPFT